MKESSTMFSGPILPLPDQTPFYMVVVEGSNVPPRKKHESYNQAFEESMRLAKQENRPTYVLQSISKIDLIPHITNFNLNQ